MRSFFLSTSRFLFALCFLLGGSSFRLDSFWILLVSGLWPCAGPLEFLGLLHLCTRVCARGSSRQQEEEEEGGGEAHRVSTLSLSELSRGFLFSSSGIPRTLWTWRVHLCTGVAVSVQCEEEVGGGKESRHGIVSLRRGGRDLEQRRTGGRSGARLLRGVHVQLTPEVLVQLLPHLAPPLPARARAWEESLGRHTARLWSVRGGEGKGRMLLLMCMGGGAGARRWVECGAVMPGMGERKRAFREHNRQEQRREECAHHAVQAGVCPSALHTPLHIPGARKHVPCSWSSAWTSPRTRLTPPQPLNSPTPSLPVLRAQCAPLHMQLQRESHRQPLSCMTSPSAVFTPTALAGATVPASSGSSGSGSDSGSGSGARGRAAAQ